MCICHQAV